MTSVQTSDHPICPYCEKSIEGVLVREVNGVVIRAGAPKNTASLSRVSCSIRPLRGLQQPSLFRYENNPDTISAAILTILFNADSSKLGK